MDVKVIITTTRAWENKFSLIEWIESQESIDVSMSSSRIIFDYITINNTFLRIVSRVELFGNFYIVSVRAA